jgi:pimeloyl-ACP methyl ester carboxylesterase
MIEKDITIDSYGNRLSGTLCLPEGKGRFPLVIMVHGSGPLDRDENMNGQQLNVFNTIAHRLASEGIASLRYDKRGCGRSSGDYHVTGHADLVNDAVGWFDALKQYDFCEPEKIFMLGHSEGCIIAPQVSIVRPAVAGLILLCPFVDNMESILIKQAGQLQQEFEALPGMSGLIQRLLSRMMGTAVTSQQKIIDKLKSSDRDVIHVQFQKIPAKWLRELIHLDSRVIFRQVRCPMLLIGGEKDLQCDPDDVNRIAGLTTGVVNAHVIKNLTHILRFDERQPSLLGTPELTRKPMEPIVLELIVAWFKERVHIQQTANIV